MSSAISDEGIIIHQTRFGEADKFVKILSRHHGFIDTVAKGARRPTSKKSSHLDNLNLIKFQTQRGNDPQYLSQVETLNRFKNIKDDLRRIRTCFYLSEIINLTVAHNQPDEELFLKFTQFLLDLNGEAADDRELAVVFQRFIINRLGFPLPANYRPQTLVDYFESIIDRRLVTREIKIS